MKKTDTKGVVRLSDADWMKLRDFSDAITKKLRPKLPGDWYLPDEDIRSQVYGTFIKLLQSWRPGAMSATSWCWQWGEKCALEELFREYRRLKKQEPIDDYEDSDEEGEEQKTRGSFKQEPYKPLADHLEDHDLAAKVQEIADKNGLGKIAKLLGTMTERQMAEELCQSQNAVHRKIEKLRKLCEGI